MTEDEIVRWHHQLNGHVAAAAAKVCQSCPTLCDPHRWQPTRLLHPWDFPDKSTRVGCQYLHHNGLEFG